MMNRLMMKLSMVLLPAMFAGSVWAADGPQPEPPKPTQSQLALDHGPHAQVTPAVKKERLAKGKTASDAQSK